MAIVPGTASPESAVLTQAEFNNFRDLIYRETGIVLNASKSQLVVSRLSRRLKALGLDSFSGYYNHLLRQDLHRDELVHMINCITTNKTSFFREPHHFTFLRSCLTGKAGERLAAEKGRRLRIWSAGCSTGEEPYTIAITLAEALSDIARWDVRMLATDIDTAVLATAQAGIYPADRLSGLSPERRSRYFVPSDPDDSMQARPELMELIAFRRLNLIGEVWPMRKRFDFIFCRNVIIYFDRPTQERLLRRFASYLEPGGYFFAGHSESLFWAKDWLEPVGDTIYRLRREIC